MASEINGKITIPSKGIGPAIPVVKPLDPAKDVAKPKAVPDRAALNPNTATQAANTAQKRTDDLLNYGVADDQVGKGAAGQTAKDPSKTTGKTSPPESNRVEKGIASAIGLADALFCPIESGRRQAAAVMGHPAPPRKDRGAKNEVLPLLPGEVRCPGSKSEEPTAKDPSKTVGKPVAKPLTFIKEDFVAFTEVGRFFNIGAIESGRRNAAALMGKPAPPQGDWGPKNEVLPLLPGEVRRPIPKK